MLEVLDRRIAEAERLGDAHQSEDRWTEVGFWRRLGIYMRKLRGTLA